MDSAQFGGWVIFIGGTIIILAAKYWSRKFFAARNEKARRRKE